MGHHDLTDPALAVFKEVGGHTGKRLPYADAYCPFADIINKPLRYLTYSARPFAEVFGSVQVLNEAVRIAAGRAAGRHPESIPKFVQP